MGLRSFVDKRTVDDMKLVGKQKRKFKRLLKLQLQLTYEESFLPEP